MYNKKKYPVFNEFSRNFSDGYPVQFYRNILENLCDTPTTFGLNAKLFKKDMIKRIYK